MNTYRVDRVSQPVVPCGMASIVYVGDSWRAAKKAYERTKPGVSPWGVADDLYGVVLSVWDGNDYKIKWRKGV